MVKRLFAILALCLGSLTLIGSTYAGPVSQYFSDTETSTGNTFSATTLDFSLRDTSNVILSSPLFNVSSWVPGNSETKTVRVKKEATENYNYQINYTKTGGDDALCNVLQIEAKFEGATKYSGDLASLNITPALINTGVSDDWDLTINLTNSSSALKNKTCSFDLIYKGWQTNSDGTWGFSSIKTLSNTVATGIWVSSSDIVINEIMWMGSDGHTGDEWIELRNTTGSDINLSGWKIENAGESGTAISLSGTIGAHGYFLLSNYATNASAVSDSISADLVTTDVSLLDGGEQLTLKSNLNVTIDQTPTVSWAAGTNGTDKQSMERNDNPSTGWHTCTDLACNDTTYWDAEGNNYGTPKAANLSQNDPSSQGYVPPVVTALEPVASPSASSSGEIVP